MAFFWDDTDPFGVGVDPQNQAGPPAFPIPLPAEGTAGAAAWPGLKEYVQGKYAGLGEDTGGDGGGGGGASGAFAWPGYGGPRSPNYGNLPRVPAFRAPTFDWNSASLYLDPGFQFRMKEGADALERSAAGRGVLRTGGTLKDILGWGQNFASQEYGNAFDRAARVFDTRYTGAKDEYSPQFSQWQALFNAEKSRADKEWSTYWDDYLQSLDMQKYILGLGQA